MDGTQKRDLQKQAIYTFPTTKINISLAFLF